jgi:sugar phosphate isomerase/epimerase
MPDSKLIDLPLLSCKSPLMNRRTFVRSSVAVATALPSLSSVSSAFAAEAATGRKFTLALTPGSIGVSVKSQQELNDLAHRHGYESVEPRGSELAAMSPAQLEETLSDLSAKKLVWASAGLPVDFRKDEALFREGLAGLPTIAAALQKAGATRIGTWLMPAHGELTYRKNFDQHVSRLREVAKVLGDHGMSFGLEYVGTQLLLVGQRYPFLHTFAETRELITEIGTGNVGHILDSWHWWTAGDTVEELLTLENKDIVSVDLNDAPVGLEKEDQMDNARELPAATGVIEVAPFLNALREIGYDGPIRAEPFNKALNALENEEASAATIAAMRKAVEAV